MFFYIHKIQEIKEWQSSCCNFFNDKQYITHLQKMLTSTNNIVQQKKFYDQNPAIVEVVETQKWQDKCILEIVFRLWRTSSVGRSGYRASACHIRHQLKVWYDSRILHFTIIEEAYLLYCKIVAMIERTARCSSDSLLMFFDCQSVIPLTFVEASKRPKGTKIPLFMCY